MTAVDAAPQPLETPPAVDAANPSEAGIGVARAAAGVEAGGSARIGEYLGASADDAVATSVRFAAAEPGYGGWFWSVTIATVGDDSATVSEVVLLPGAGALLAPGWVPWEERLQPGDLGVGDLLPTAPDDERLVPAYLESADPAVEDLAHEIGIGRRRVLSPAGRDEAADRWHDGDFGAGAPMAVQAPASCSTCGFYVPLAGALGAAFGACANEFSPADGRVVDLEYGCGAHSELAPIEAPPAAVAVLDELIMDVHPRPDPPDHGDRPGDVTDVDAEAGAGSTDPGDGAPAGAVPEGGHAEAESEHPGVPDGSPEQR